MHAPGTTNPGRNDPARFDGHPADALRKPDKLLGEGQDYVLLPLGQRMAEGCINLARRLTAPHKRRYPYLADEIDGEARLALIRAAAFFDPKRGMKFSTLAGFSAVRAAESVIRRRGPRGYQRSAEESPQTASMHWGDGLIAVEGIGATATDPGEDLDRREIVEIIGTIMAKMEPRLADILRRRHIEGQTLEEIGDVYGITKERVRQLELRAGLKIRESVAAG